MDVLKRNNVLVTGRGEKPIIFAHGYGCDQNMWRFVAPAFLDDYQVILFDQVGFGKSDVSAYNKNRYNSLQAYADDVLEICAALNLAPAIFVGHSVSAIIGVLAAIKKPIQFEKLVLVGPSPKYINEGSYAGGFTEEDIQALIHSLESNYLGWSSAIAPVIMGNPERPDLAEELVNSFCRANPEIAKDFARLTFLSDNRADLVKLKIKSLILQCSEDIIAPQYVGEYTHQSIAGSRFIKLQATGHCPNLSAPEETIAAIKSFL